MFVMQVQEGTSEKEQCNQKKFEKLLLIIPQVPDAVHRPQGNDLSAVFLPSPQEALARRRARETCKCLPA